MTHADEPDERAAATDAAVRPGSLLVSSVELVEPAFRRTVVYMIEHNDSGSFGVVINRPSDTAVHGVFPRWAPLSVRPATLHVGGPVRRDSALCLATTRTGVDVSTVPGLRRVDGRVAMVDLDSDPGAVAPAVDGIRIFAGYAGWTAGQLDGEVARGDWVVISALASDVVAPPTTDLWSQVLRRQPLPLALLASHPIDVSRN